MALSEVKSAAIIGGSGFLGSHLVEHILGHHPHIRTTVISRDEHKQQTLKRQYQGIKYVLGDVRDKDSLTPHLKGIDVVFHVAALKHVDHLEDNPLESVKTNILGSINVANACMDAGVKYCMFSSSDKAVDPINVYGYCKATSEKILIHYNSIQDVTFFSVYRWGNILSSTGSCIPFFIECLKAGKPIPLTHGEMTRFWLPIESAVEFVFDTFWRKDESLWIHPLMKSAPTIHIIATLAHLMNVKSGVMSVIGLRKGEKMHEALRSAHGPDSTSSLDAEKYTGPQLEDLLRPIVEKYA